MKKNPLKKTNQKKNNNNNNNNNKREIHIRAPACDIPCESHNLIPSVNCVYLFGYEMPACAYEFHLVVFISINHWLTAGTREISAWRLQEEIRIRAGVRVAV